MRYFLIDQEKHILSVEAFLANPGSNPALSAFVRREVLNEAIVAPSNDKSRYISLARKLGFRWEPNGDLGHMQYDAKANLMRRLVQDYARQLVHAIGFPVYEVHGANMFNLSHPIVAAYADLYGDLLYHLQSGANHVVMSYDASFPQFNLASQMHMSYKHLPFAHFSIADCYRQEQHGELMQLVRQRRFFMPDIHPYFCNIAEAFSWFPKIQEQILEGARSAKMEYQILIEIPSQEVFDAYQQYIERIPEHLGKVVLVHILNDGIDRYWVINVDYKFIDKLGQSREIACIQVDIGNAPRLNMQYIDAKGCRQFPIIIHAAIPGGIERFIYMVLDQYDDLGIPLWLQPVQLRLLAVAAPFVAHCQAFIRQHEHFPIRMEVDDRNISIASKVKSARNSLIQQYVVVGQREINDGFQGIEAQLANLAQNVVGKPYIRREWPCEVIWQFSEW